MSDQVTIVDFQDLQKAIKIAKREQRPIQIDWVNRTIRVLSDVKTHPTRVLSTGPMTYQDVLFTVDHE